MRKVGRPLRGECLTDAQKSEIIRLYLSGLGSVCLGRQFGISDGAIIGVLKRAGVERRSYSEATRRLSLNEAAFSKITENSAYWAGFLMADGTIRKRPGAQCVALVVSEKDAAHIVKFRRFVNSGHKIASRCCSPNGRGGASRQVGIEFNSAKMVSDLAKMGVTPNKSFTACASLELALNRHFWRGMIDGDGTIGLWKNKTSKTGIHPAIALAGSFSIASQFRNYVKYLHPNFSGAIHRQDKIFKVIIMGPSAAKIIANLYGESAIFLSRKKRLADKIMELYPTQRDLSF